MKDANLSTAEASERVERHIADAEYMLEGLESPEDENHENYLKNAAAEEHLKAAGYLAYLGNDLEAREQFRNSATWYLRHVEQARRSETLSLEGTDGTAPFVDLIQAAILSDDEELVAEASEICHIATVENVPGAYDWHLAYVRTLSALLQNGDVTDELAELESCGPKFSELITGMAEAIQGIDREEPSQIIDGIERLLEQHAETAEMPIVESVCLRGLALFTVARKRSLVEHIDISAYRAYLPEYQPGIQ